tara:strand:- start:9 stop:773 length:765 start_codon:yes stop_codon:yes gene_type:complete
MGKNTKVRFSMHKIKILLLAFMLMIPVSFSYKWASYRNIFVMKNIKIEGNAILEKRDYLEIIGNLNEKQIADVDTKSLSKDLEAIAFVKAARVSRHYPNEIKIDIVERKPIAIINNKKQFLIDNEAVILPDSKSFIETALIPMLSGFNPADDLYPEGSETFSVKVKEAVEILEFIQFNYSEFFDEISELTINKDDEFEIVLSEQPTRVILGKNNIHIKINILKKFGEALGQRQLTDYKLLDMRYSKQLVAREWI